MIRHRIIISERMDDNDLVATTLGLSKYAREVRKPERV